MGDTAASLGKMAASASPSSGSFPLRVWVCAHIRSAGTAESVLQIRLLESAVDSLERALNAAFGGSGEGVRLHRNHPSEGPTINGEGHEVDTRGGTVGSNLIRMYGSSGDRRGSRQIGPFEIIAQQGGAGSLLTPIARTDVKTRTQVVPSEIVAALKKKFRLGDDGKAVRVVRIPL